MRGRYYSAQDLAELWNVGIDSVYDVLKSGNLRGFKVGHVWRVTDEAVRAFENASPPVAAQIPKQKIISII